jgi:hypothetical protein
LYRAASGTTGAGSPTQVAPRFSVRTIDVHGLAEHGAVPRTNASSAETNVTEVAANPLGTGPPAGVLAGLVAAGLLAAGVVDAALWPPVAVDVAVEVAPGPEPELAVPHPARNTTVNSAVKQAATRDARIEIFMSPPDAVAPGAVSRPGARFSEMSLRHGDVNAPFPVGDHFRHFRWSKTEPGADQWSAPGSRRDLDG